MLFPDTTMAEATFMSAKVPHVPVAHLLEVELRARPRGRNTNGRQQISGLQDVQAGDVDVGTDEVVLRIDDALTLGRADDEFGVQRDQRRSRVGRDSPPRSGRAAESRARGCGLGVSA